jgi:hypothetical protein
MSYNLLLDYIRSAEYRILNGVRVYDDERIVAVEDEDYLLAIQAHDETAWKMLLEAAAKNPAVLKELVVTIEEAKDTLLPGSVTVMRIRKRDLEKTA